MHGAAQLVGHARSAGFELPDVVDTVIAASSGTRFWGAAELGAFVGDALPHDDVTMMAVLRAAKL